MNQGRLIAGLDVDLRGARSCRRTAIPPTVSPAAVPSSVTLVIISVSWSARLATRSPSDCSSGSSSSIVRPSGSLASWRKVGFISVPSLATAAATSAICIGVVSSRSWPIATRPMSIASPASSSLPSRIVDAARRHLVVGVVELGVRVEAEALHVLEHRLGAELLADLGPVGVDRVGEGEVMSMSPKVSPPEFSSGTPPISIPVSPLSIVSGVNSPESSAAAAVTTFIVEPGW